MKPFSSFFLGIVGALGALFIEAVALVFSTPLSATAETLSLAISSFGFLFFFAIIAEEFLKFILLRKIISAPFSLLNALFFGLGFSALEMGMLWWNYRNGSPFGILGTVGVLLLHISTAIVIGYALTKNQRNYIRAFFFGFIPAIAMHSAYNSLRILEFPQQHTALIAMLIGMSVIDMALLALSTRRETTTVL